MEPGSARGGWVERVAFAVGVIALAAVIAARAYPVGLIQGRYDVGAPGWVEGSFGWLYLVIGGIVGLIALGLAAFIARGGAARLRRRLRTALLVAVAALWAGYGAGWLTAAALGPSLERPGAVRFMLGPPIGAAIETAATCVSSVDDGDLLAELDPVDETVPVVYLRHRVERSPYPTIIDRGMGRSFLIPGAEPTPIGPYDWTVQSIEEQPDAGRLVLSGRRWGSGTGPPSIAVEVTWACERGST